MTGGGHNEIRILAVDPTTKGFGYVIFEGPLRVVDWGAAAVRGEKNAGCLSRIQGLIRLYKPEVIVLESPRSCDTRRCDRVQSLLKDIRTQAGAWGVRVSVFSREQVREVFAPVGAKTKHQIAKVLADRYREELSPRMPPFRQPWMSEDERMAMFDAAALAVVFFYRNE